MLHIPLLFAAVIAASSINSADIASVVRQSSDPQLDTLVVEGRRQLKTSDFAATSVTTLDRSVLLTMPGTANDLNRVLAVHPSALSTGAFDNNALYVRGGNPTENVYLIDGIAFDDINHFPLLNRPGGAFGFVDPEMIDKLDFYAGGIPVCLPSRTSSAIDISLRNGATDHFSGRADLSLTGFGLGVEGPLPASKGSFMVSMRFADLRLLSNINDALGTPRYGDGLFKGTIDLKRAGTLLVHAIGSFDYYRGVSGERAQGYAIDNYAELESNVGAGGLTWKKTLARVSSTMQFSVSRTEFGRSRIYTGLGDTIESIMTPIRQDSLTISYTTQTTRLSGDTIWALGGRKKNICAIEHVAFQLGENIDLAAGLSAEFHRFHIHDQYGIGRIYCHSFTRRDSIHSWFDEGCDSSIAYDHNTSVDALQTGAYMQALVRFGQFSLVPGLRADYYKLIDRGGLSPRLSLAFKNDAVGRFAVSASIIRQLPTDLDRILDYLLWYRFSGQQVDVALDDLKLQRCFQGNVSYNRNLGRFHFVGLEAYGKRYDGQYRQITPSRRSIDAYYMNVNEGVGLMRIAPPKGKQHVYGIETTVSSVRDRRLFYSGAFSYSVSRYEYVDGSWQTDNFGVCKKASLLAGFSMSKEHSLTANLLVMTGRLYEKGYNNSTGEFLNGSIDGTPYAGRLDPVYSLSARYTFEHRVRRLTIGAYLEAINILNKKQVIDRVADGDGFLDQRMMGILPNAAVMVAF